MTNMLKGPLVCCQSSRTAFAYEFSFHINGGCLTIFCALTVLYEGDNIDVATCCCYVLWVAGKGVTPFRRPTNVHS